MTIEPDFYESNSPLFARWDKYKHMTPSEYRDQLMELIEWAGMELSDDQANMILTEVFTLLYKRLGVKIKAHIYMPGSIV